MYFMYELKLEGGCFYIGITKSLKRRLGQHKKGKGAAFTKRNHYLKCLKVTKLFTSSKKIAAQFEDAMTLRYIDRYGLDRVRGGRYAQSGIWDTKTQEIMYSNRKLVLKRPKLEKTGSIVL